MWIAAARIVPNRTSPLPAHLLHHWDPMRPTRRNGSPSCHPTFLTLAPSLLRMSTLSAWHLSCSLITSTSRSLVRPHNQDHPYQEVILTLGHEGYVQGMSDLCSPIYVITGADEELTFWCFVEVMSRMVCLSSLLGYFPALIDTLRRNGTS